MVGAHTVNAPARQSEREIAAFARLAGDEDLTTMLLHHRAHDCQPKTGAFNAFVTPARLDPEEAVKNARQINLSNANTRITHFHADPFALIARGNRNRAIFPVIFDGVAD